MTSPLAAFKRAPEGAPVLVIARFRCRCGDEAETERRLNAHMSGTHQEAGCERYALHPIVENPCEWMLVERWTSKDAFRAHHRMPYMADLAELAGRLAEPPQVWFLHESSEGDPAKGRI
jgi:quinol monooxygenase YgiN